MPTTVFTVTITDNNGKSISATCTFHSTPAGGTDEPGETQTPPTIAWPDNSTFASMPISPDMQAELDITAAGGIKTFVGHCTAEPRDHTWLFSDLLPPLIS